MPSHSVILGAGVVGQLFGAALHRHGHRVTFVVRPKRRDALLEHGIQLTPQRGDSYAITLFEDGPSRGPGGAPGLVTSFEELGDMTYLFLCVRSDQLSEAFAQIAEPGGSGATGVVCCPMWRWNGADLPDCIARWAYLLPGLGGVFHENEIVYKMHTTGVATLGDGPPETAQGVATLLRESGIPTRTRPHLMRDMQTILAVGLPILAGIGAAYYDLQTFCRDRVLVRMTVQAQRDALTALRAMGEPLGLLGNLTRTLPLPITGMGLRLMNPCLRGLTREMIEIHFRKTHRQTIHLLRDLEQTASARGAETPHLAALLAKEPDAAP